MEREWELFLAPYEQAVSELKVKLRGIRKQFRSKINTYQLNSLQDV